jgi:hypothetical protein
MKFNPTKFICSLMIVFTSIASFKAQDVAAEDHTYKPLTLKLNETGSKYIRFIMWHQFWVTATQNNPGTRDVNGLPIDGTRQDSSQWSTDIALRRSRFLAVRPDIAQIHDIVTLGYQ